jgi:hypothetical protein
MIPVVFALSDVLHRSYVIITSIRRERKIPNYKVALVILDMVIQKPV